MAYFLLTVLEEGIAPPNPSKTQKGPKRVAAAKRFYIDVDVLAKIGLTTTRGGPRARKVHGLHLELTSNETTWLEEATKMMIRRAGEIAANPTGQHQPITMAQLPTL